MKNETEKELHKINVFQTQLSAFLKYRHFTPPECIKKQRNVYITLAIKSYISNIYKPKYISIYYVERNR